MSVIMSDMKRTFATPATPTFTVRDMNRSTQAVLNACRIHGSAIIRSRSGENFKIEPVAAENNAVGPSLAFTERLRKHRERMRSLGFEGPRPSDQERFNRIVSGEE